MSYFAFFCMKSLRCGVYFTLTAHNLIVCSSALWPHVTTGYHTGWIPRCCCSQLLVSLPHTRESLCGGRTRPCLRGASVLMGTDVMKERGGGADILTLWGAGASRA